ELIATEYRFRRPREPELALRDYLVRFPEFRVQSLAIWEDVPDSGAVARRKTGGSPRPFPIESGAFPGGRDWAEPENLGKFELQGVIGRGAFGIVYRARDTELDRVVALKVPRPGDLASREGPSGSCVSPATRRLHHGASSRSTSRAGSGTPATWPAS
ncbi:MAG: hypothetical protein WKF75_11905, partial [Singulisphaera sp.]